LKRVSSDNFKIGEVYRYSYLWSREALIGEESGRKDRPACIVFKFSGETDLLLIYPITTKQPASDRLAIEVPAAERRRCGLNDISWIIVDEANSTQVSNAYDFSSFSPLGRFSATFVAKVQQLAKTVIRTRRLNQVKRT
jgi:hypothetical protein